MTTPGNDRDSSGTYSPKATDDELVAAVRAHSPAGTAEVGDEVGISRQAAYERLKDLRDEGRVNSKKIAASLVWFPASERDGEPDTDTGADTASTSASDTEPRERREPAASGSAGDQDDSVAVDTEPDEAASEHVQAVVDAVAAGTVDVDGAGWDDDHRLANRKAAARAVLEHAVATGEPVGQSDAVDRFHDQHPIEEQNTTETWWQKNVRPVLSAVGSYSKSTRSYHVDPDQLAAVARGDTDT